MSKGGGGIGFGTIAVVGWILFTIFGGDDDEDKSPPVAEITVEETKPQEETKSKFDETISNIKIEVKEFTKKVKPEVKKLVNEVKEELKGKDEKTDLAEVKEESTLILVKPELHEEEVTPENQINEKETELSELEENAPDDSELTFTPL